jgi:PPP family 3-phenylpropionic acid transporter
VRLNSQADARRAIAGYITLYMAIGALYPYIPIYYASLGIELDSIGLLAAAFAGAAMVGGPLWGATADHLGASRPVLALAAATAAVAAVALAFVGGILAIAVTAVMLSVAMAGITPILDARAMEVVGIGRARYGRLRVWGSGSFIFAVVVTGWIVEGSGIRSMFAVLVLALAATALVGLRIRSHPGNGRLPRLAALAAVLRSATLMPFLAVLLLTWTSAAAVNAFFSIRLVQVGAPESLVGIAWALGAAVEVPIMLAFPVLARRFGLNRLLLAGAALFAVRAAALVLTADPLIVSLTMLIHGGAFALVLVGGVMYVSEHAPNGAAATAQGMLGATGFGLAQVVGPGFGGLLGGALGLPPMFGLAGIGSAVAVVALALVLGRCWPARPLGTSGQTGTA